MHAEKCPVCLGSGKVQQTSNSIKLQDDKHTVSCHGCGGRGWVEVRDEPVFIPNADAIKFGER